MWLIELTHQENEGCSVLSEFWWTLESATHWISLIMIKTNAVF